MSTTSWLLLAAVIPLALLFDLKAHDRGPEHEPSLRAAAAWSAFWTVLGLAFTLVLVALSDRSAAPGEYLTGFLIEKSLSLDNLFVFIVLLAYFKVPAASQKRVLIWGIAGAIVLRALFIVAGSAALDAFHATIYVFGGILILTAIKLARQTEEHVDVDDTLALRALRRVMPVGDYDGERFTTQVDGRRHATPLLACLVMIAAFDVLFAIDSVPAIFAVSRDTYVVFAANAFSLLGMTSLYFLLRGMLDRFWALHHGLALILAFVGVKMLLSDVWHMPSWLSLAVIVGTLLATAAVSVRFSPPGGRGSRPGSPAATSRSGA